MKKSSDSNRNRKMHSLRLESLESRQMLSTNPVAMPAVTDTAEIVGDQNMDVTASIPTAKWLGDVSTGWYDAENVKESYTLQTAAQFAGFAELVNSGVTFEGITITLACNINLNNIEWTPIGQSFMPNGDDSYDENPFLGTFDGGGCTISNLKITGDGDYAGLFGCVGYKIGNFTLDGVSVSGDCYVGSAVGKVWWDTVTKGMEFDIHDITVKNFEVTGNQKVGGILGAAYCFGENIIQNCSVESGSVSQVDPAEGHCGGIVGQYMEGEKKPNRIVDCTVKDVEITGGRRTGGVVGSTSALSAINSIDELFYGNTIENVTLTGISNKEMKAPGAIVGWSNDAFDASDDSVSKSDNTVKNVSVKYTNDEGVLVDIPVTALGAQSTADGTVQDIEPVVAVIRDKDGNTTWSFSDFEEAVNSSAAFGADVVLMTDMELDYVTIPVNVNIVTNGKNINGTVFGRTYGSSTTPVTVNGVTYAKTSGSTVMVDFENGAVSAGNGAEIVDISWFYAPNEDGTYTISTAEQLAGFAALVNTGISVYSFSGKTVCLGDDINLSAYENWSPIGWNSSYPFYGSFDGCGHTISGLTINKSTKSYAGLFGAINGNNSVIGNFKLENVSIDGQYWVSGVCGYAKGTIDFQNIELTGDINIKGRWYVGGIVGQVPYSHDIDFIGCKVSGNEGSKIESVTSDDGTFYGGYNAGGILGQGPYTEIKDCEVSGITVEAYYRAGGLAGWASAEQTNKMHHTGNTVSNCVIVANKEWPEDYEDSAKAEYSVGALFGEDYSYIGDANIDTNKVENVTTKIIMQDGTEVLTSTDDAAPAIGGRTNVAIYDSEGNSLGKYYMQELTPGVLSFDLTGDITADDICFKKDGSEAALDSVGLNINTNGHTLTITDPNNTELLDNLAANSPEAKVEIIDVAWYDDAPEGTTEYTIDSAYALAYFAELVNTGKDTFEGKTVKLAEESEIDLSIYEKWTPIGTSSAYSFKGTFDGQDSVISNLTINDAAQSYAGLFGYISGKAVVENFTLKDVFIVGKYRVGAVVGGSNSASIVRNVTVEGADITGYWYVGGILGQNGSNGESKIVDCTVKGTETMNSIKGVFESSSLAGVNVGGIAGHYAYNTIENCTVEGMTISGFHRTGGIAGYASTDSANTLKHTGNTVTNTTVIEDKVQDGREYEDEWKNLYSAGAILGGENVYVGDGNADSNTYEDVTTIIKKADGTVVENDTPALVGGVTLTAKDAAGNSIGSVHVANNGDGSCTVTLAEDMMTDSIVIDGIYGDMEMKVATNGYTLTITDPDAELVEIATADPENDVLVVNTSRFADMTQSTFYVYDAQELAALAVLVNNGTSFAGKTIELASDIDLSVYENWTPIGTTANPFKGTFDGHNYTISNLTINDADGWYLGLFGYVTGTKEGISIKDFTLENVYIRGFDYVAAVAGGMSGGNTVIDNVKVTGLDIDANHYIGGIIGGCGVAGTNVIKNCVVTGTESMNTIKAEFDVEIGNDGDAGKNVGGIAGHFAYNTITDCTVTGMNISGYHRVGGIAGYASGGSVDTMKHSGNSVTNCVITVNKNIGEDYTDKNKGVYSVGTMFGQEDNYVLDGSGTQGEMTGNTTQIITADGETITRRDTVVGSSSVTVRDAQGSSVGKVSLENNGDGTYVLTIYSNITTNALNLNDAFTGNIIAVNTNGFTLTLTDKTVLDGLQVDDMNNVVFDESDWYTNPAEEGVYVISTAGELAKLAQLVNDGTDSFNGKTVILDADIDLSVYENWTPIGTSANTFQGTFDGGGYTISNLTIDDASLSRAGLFGAVGVKDWSTNTTTIKNFTLDGVTINAASRVGAVVGEGVNIYGDASNQFYVQDVTVKNANITGREAVGGIIGYAGGCGKNVISNCKLEGENNTITAAPVIGENGSVSGGGHAGGIAGYFTYNTLKDNSVTNATIKALWSVGGIAGDAADDVPTSFKHTGNTISNTTIIVDKGTDLALSGYAGGYTAGAMFGLENNYPGDGKPEQNTIGDGVTVQVVQNGEVVATLENKVVGSTFLTVNGTFSIVESTEDGDARVVLLGNMTASDFELPGIFADSTVAEVVTNGKSLTITDAAILEETTVIGDYILDESDWYTNPSEEGVYVISTAGELAKLAELVNSGTDNFDGKTILVDAAELDLSAYENWTPIGTAANSFWGTFDGQDCVITGLTINDPTLNSAGLFGALSTGSWAKNTTTLKNFTIKNANITAGSNVGAAAGLGLNLSGDAPNQFQILNVHVIDSTITGKSYVGGLFGSAGGGGKNVIENCTVTNCTVTSKLTFDENGEVVGGYHVGGVVGNFAYNRLTSNTVTGTDVSGYYCVGGIAGYASDDWANRFIQSGNTITDSTVTVDKTNDTAYEDDYRDVYSAGSMFGLEFNYFGDGSEAVMRPNTTDDNLPNAGANTAENVTVKIITADGEEIVKESSAAIGSAVATINGTRVVMDIVSDSELIVTLTGDLTTDKLELPGIYGDFEDAEITVQTNGHTLTVTDADSPLVEQSKNNPADEVIVVDTTWYDPEASELTIDSAKGLAYLAQLVNTGVDNFAGKTVKLAADIDLSEYANWTPIGQSFMPTGAGSYKEVPFLGTFDGQGYTISNLTITGDTDYAGLFGCIGYKVGNFTLENVKVSGDTYVGAAVGKVWWDTVVKNMEFEIHDITVRNFEIVGNQQVGGVLGAAYCWYADTIQNCTVENGTIRQNEKADGHCGGIVGQFMEGGTYPDRIIGCTVKDVEIFGSVLVGGIAGSTDVTSATNKFSELFYGNTVENVTITSIGSTYAEFPGFSAPGAILGWSDAVLEDENGNYIQEAGNTIKNVTVKITNEDGSVTDIPVQAVGLVQTNSSEGNTIVEDVAPAVAVIVDAEGNTSYSFSSLQEALDFFAAQEDGNTVVLTQDVVEDVTLPEGVALQTGDHSYTGTITSAADDNEVTFNGVTYGMNELEVEGNLIQNLEDAESVSFSEGGTLAVGDMIYTSGNGDTVVTIDSVTGELTITPGTNDTITRNGVTTKASVELTINAAGEQIDFIYQEGNNLIFNLGKATAGVSYTFEYKLDSDGDKRWKEIDVLISSEGEIIIEAGTRTFRDGKKYDYRLKADDVTVYESEITVKTLERPNYQTKTTGTVTFTVTAKQRSAYPTGTSINIRYRVQAVGGKWSNWYETSLDELKQNGAAVVENADGSCTVTVSDQFAGGNVQFKAFADGFMDLTTNTLYLDSQSVSKSVRLQKPKTLSNPQLRMDATGIVKSFKGVSNASAENYTYQLMYSDARNGQYVTLNFTTEEEILSITSETWTSLGFETGDQIFLELTAISTNPRDFLSSRVVKVNFRLKLS
ncbi:MAG: hypothetical protein IJD43_00955 [Thermoguttaceae bacterium]|nr:hypothetical protein [Thermoguttaceae bacterium]